MPPRWVCTRLHGYNCTLNPKIAHEELIGLTFLAKGGLIEPPILGMGDQPIGLKICQDMQL